MSPTLPLGVDIVEWKKAGAFYRAHRERLSDLLHPGELAYVETSSRPSRAFALVFSAKEAVFKALGAPWMGRTGFRDVELFPEKGFTLRLRGRLKKDRPSGVPLTVSFKKSNRHVVASCRPVPCAGT
jgi:phosphopantetheine--protein transferase-like protein